MKFETLGQPDRPAVVLIHGSFCSDRSSRRFGQFLAQNHYVVMPVLDGHDGGEAELVNAPMQAAKILSYLMTNGIEHVDMVHGTSMGAVMALHMMHQNEVLQKLRTQDVRQLTIDRCVLDGGVFFAYPKVIRWVLYLFMLKTVKGLKQPDKAHAVDRTLYSWSMRGMFTKKPEPFRPMVEDMYETCAGMTKETVRAVAECCYDVALPKLSKENEERLWFHYSLQEPAMMNKKVLLKTYPDAAYHDVKEPGHCGMQLREPEAYAAYLTRIMSGEEQPDPKPQPKEQSKPTPEQPAPEVQPEAQPEQAPEQAE